MKPQTSNHAIPPTEDSPRAEYERRRARRRDELQRQERRDRLASQGRLATFLVIVAVGWLSLWSGRLSAWWLVPAVASFVGSVLWHWHVLRALERASLAVEYYDRALARLDDRWAGTGPTGARYREPDHPYAADLDLLGKGSLFQLLCTARTQMGQDTLAAWLLNPANVETIRARQDALRELRVRLDLREELGLLTARIRLDTDPQALRNWMADPPRLVDRTNPVLAVLLALASIATLVGWIVLGWGLGFWGLVVFFQAVLLVRLRRPMRELTQRLDPVLAELCLVLEVLRIMEVQQLASPCLAQLLRRLRAGGQLPSRRIARLVRLIDYWETIRRNQFVAPIAFLLMLNVHLAYAIERWRVRHQHDVSEWLQAVGEFEALCALAGYAYEHPEQPFPEIADAEPVFDAQGLGHPLIPSGRRVCNDLRLDRDRQLLLVSGSNMSGKSTLLRTVGINVVLALAGAPVCASRMQVSRLTVASAMRHVDSLQEGVSAFYAEIQRLHRIHDLAAETPPVLFLLDEILRGTNSHDRRGGAEAVIENLLRHGAIGLITTHDLALAEIADRLAPRAANVHFEDELRDGRLAFDYRLRPGVVPKGNGLVLMRLLGFEV